MEVSLSPCQLGWAGCQECDLPAGGYSRPHRLRVGRAAWIQSPGSLCSPLCLGVLFPPPRGPRTLFHPFCPFLQNFLFRKGSHLFQLIHGTLKLRDALIFNILIVKGEIFAHLMKISDINKKDRANWLQWFAHWSPTPSTAMCIWGALLMWQEHI